MFYGNEPLEKLILPAAKIEFDKFIKQYKVSTVFFNDKLIRGSLDAKTNKIIFIQLYVKLGFINDWGFIDKAVDIDGKMHDLVKISTDVEVGDVLTYLTEIVGISLDRKFLEEHTDGFEIKAYGAKERIISVPGQLIKSFLFGLDNAIALSINDPNND